MFLCIFLFLYWLVSFDCVCVYMFVFICARVSVSARLFLIVFVYMCLCVYVTYIAFSSCAELCDASKVKYYCTSRKLMMSLLISHMTYYNGGCYHLPIPGDKRTLIFYFHDWMSISHSNWQWI